MTTRPSLDLIRFINDNVLDPDERFNEPDELHRIEIILDATSHIEVPVELAATLAYRIARAQAFVEGNKRTALLVALWVLDQNGHRAIPDRDLAYLLVMASMGIDVEDAILAWFRSR